MNLDRLAPKLYLFRLEREEKMKIDINTIGRDQGITSPCGPQAKGFLISQSLKI